MKVRALLVVLASAAMFADGIAYSPAIGPLTLNQSAHSVTERFGPGQKRNHCFGEAHDHDCDYELVYSDSRNLLLVTVTFRSVVDIELLQNAAKRYGISQNTREGTDFSKWAWEGGMVFPVKPPHRVANWKVDISKDGLDYYYSRGSFGVWIAKGRFGLGEE